MNGLEWLTRKVHRVNAWRSELFVHCVDHGSKLYFLEV